MDRNADRSNDDILENTLQMVYAAQDQATKASSQLATQTEQLLRIDAGVADIHVSLYRSEQILRRIGSISVAILSKFRRTKNPIRHTFVDAPKASFGAIFGSKGKKEEVKSPDEVDSERLCEIPSTVIRDQKRLKELESKIDLKAPLHNGEKLIYFFHNSTKPFVRDTTNHCLVVTNTRLLVIEHGALTAEINMSDVQNVNYKQQWLAVRYEKLDVTVKEKEAPVEVYVWGYEVATWLGVRLSLMAEANCDPNAKLWSEKKMVTNTASRATERRHRRDRSAEKLGTRTTDVTPTAGKHLFEYTDEGKMVNIGGKTVPWLTLDDETQEILIQYQKDSEKEDVVLGEISNVLDNLLQQSVDIGAELNKQNKITGHIEERTDFATNRLKRANKKVDKILKS